MKDDFASRLTDGGFTATALMLWLGWMLSEALRVAGEYVTCLVRFACVCDGLGFVVPGCDVWRYGAFLERS